MIYDFIRHWVLLLGGMQSLAFRGAGCSRITSYMHASDWHCGLFLFFLDPIITGWVWNRLVLLGLVIHDTPVGVTRYASVSMHSFSYLYLIAY
jgi:hypothetical protein